MEFHQLEYFLALEKYLSFSEAAESICISQPTLSYQIKKLEKELGTELFIRSTRNVQLTPAGAEFLKYAKRILLDIQTSKSVMLDHTNLTKGSIRIGALRLITNLGITSIIADFIKKYPGIKIQIHQGNTDVLLTKMHRGEIDVAFITTPFKFDHEFTFYPLIKDKIVLTVPSSHEIANRKIIDLSELSHQKFLMLNSSMGFKNSLLRLFQNAGFEPEIIIECGAETIKGFLEEEIGVSLLTYKIALSISSPKISIVDITSTEDRTTGLAVSKNNNLKVTKIFKDFVLYRNIRR